MDTITFQDMEKTYKDMFKIRQKFNSTNTYRVPTMCQALFWAFWGYNKELSHSVVSDPLQPHGL